MSVYGALGDSRVAAAICATVFFLGGFVCVLQVKRTKFRLYGIMGVAGFMRGISLSLRAASIQDQGSTTGEAVMHSFFLAAGFGISIAVNCLIVAGWFKNTAPEFNTAAAAKIRIGIILLFPVVIIMGPILGITNALLIYQRATDESIPKGMDLRKASSIGMLCVSSAALLVALATTAFAFSRTPTATAPHHLIVITVATTSFLVWSASVRVAGNFTHPELLSDEAFMFPLQVLPEILHYALWWVPALMARVHLSSRFDEWWGEFHPHTEQIKVAAKGGAQGLEGGRVQELSAAALV